MRALLRTTVAADRQWLRHPISVCVIKLVVAIHAMALLYIVLADSSPTFAGWVKGLYERQESAVARYFIHYIGLFVVGIVGWLGLRVAIWVTSSVHVVRVEKAREE